MFDGKNSKKIEYLEKERKKLWEAITALEKKLNERPSDIEKEAKQASKKTAEYRNRTEERLNQATEILGNIQKSESEIRSISTELSSVKEQISLTFQESTKVSDDIVERSKELISAVDKITTIFDKHPNLKIEVAELETTIEALDESASKANTTYKGILSKKIEIDELHREIIGYEDEDEEGELVKIEGLQSELENAYNELSKKSEELENQLKEINEKSQSQYTKFVEANIEDIDKVKEDSKTEYDLVIKKIESLLPNAMTAGLSSAFIAKKKEEEIIYTEYKRKFNRGILFLSLVSLLPIAVSIFFLSTGVPLSEVISRSPKVIFSFIPLYIPLIWLTISANKKVNLSKRLIEEYSHKQVLSMTIEGLSTQIENIEDNTVSKELRVQLLRSFLLVTSENPGKLISNYQKSDNPILNLFDRDVAKKKESKEEKSIVKTVEQRTKNIIEKAADEFEDTIVSTVKNTIN